MNNNKNNIVKYKRKKRWRSFYYKMKFKYKITQQKVVSTIGAICMVAFILGKILGKW